MLTLKNFMDYKKHLDKIAWCIPIKKLRDKFRDNKMNAFIKKNYDNIHNVRIPCFTITEKDTNDNLEKRKIIRDILINTENQNKCDLHNYFIENRDRAIDKWLFYFDVYERHFSKFRGKDINILEIGVQNGGSAQMWKHYFQDKYPNNKVNIYGIDIDERTKFLEEAEDNIKIFIGSQSDRDFLRKVKSEIPKVDILIDDGGHTMEQQIVTFEEMYEHVKDGGVYLCEDNHTSYWDKYGGGYGNKDSFIEYTKNFIDYMHIYWVNNKLPEELCKFRNTTSSIHYYDSMIVLEKNIRNPRYNDTCIRGIIGKATI